MTLNTLNYCEIESFVDLALSFDAEPLIMLVANPYNTVKFQRTYLKFSDEQFEEMYTAIDNSIPKVKKHKFEDAYWNMILLAYEKKENLDWVYISNNSNISFEKFLNCTDEKINKKIYWKNVHSNLSLTLDIIRKHSYIKWNYYEGLSYNENITQEFIINNIEQKWNIFALSMHKNITWEFIQKYKKT